MARQKSLDKEIELLLNALENGTDSSGEIESLDLTNDISDFINTFNISEGKNKLYLTSFYSHYKNWSPDPAEYRVFCSTIKKWFQIKTSQNSQFINIKNDLIDLNNLIIKSKKEKNHLKKSFKLKKHIEDFIQEMEIKSCEKWTKIDNIYEWYIKWRYNRKSIKLKRFELKNLLKFYFVSKIGKTRGFFKLKGEFNMEKINQLRGIHEKERKQEIKNKICGIKTGTKFENET